MTATKNDLTRLIKFSLDKYRFESAVIAFPMFTNSQIRFVYSMSTSSRKRLLEQRTNVDPVPRQYRSPEQAEKMREIASDPSNR
jgi:hypothetical protein